ncbi:MAG: SDR family oxidoreductase [Halobacteria archaeon]|nr:SDR family oxidoreductase [Halobacteria archaeon]
MLSDKVCVVAGGGHGLGEAVAVHLGELGAKVVVNDLGTSVHGEGKNKEPAQETVQRIRDNGGTATAHFGDITSLDYTERLVSDAVDEYGRVDGAVNFAGILRDSMSHKMSGEEWDDVIRVHLRGHFALLRNLASYWRETAKDEEQDVESQRSFLSVTSQSALGNVGQLNYSAAKAGVLGLTRTGARELQRYNVRVNALMPSAYTRMTETIPEEYRPYTEKEMPPEKVAPMVAFLMSDHAEDITGCTIKAGGDEVGLVSDPDIYRIGIQEGGWTAEGLAEKFRDKVARGEDLERTDSVFL